MQVRLWNRRGDYATLHEWTLEAGRMDCLPPTTRLPPSGWVVEDDGGNLVCAGWLHYFKHTPGAMVSEVFLNPSTPKDIKGKALDLLFLRLATEADRNGVEVTYAASTREGVVRRALKLGFIKKAQHSVEFTRERGG